MKSIHLILTLIVALAINQSNCRAIDDDDDVNNSVQTSNTEPKYEQKDWIKITKTPPSKLLHTSGVLTKIECEVMGSPAPTIQWIRGNIPFSELDNYETNTISESSSSAIVRVRSVLILEKIPRDHERTITCVGQSGSKTVYSSTKILGQNDKKNTYLSTISKKPYIVYSYSLYLDTVGSNIILPCQVYSHDHLNPPQIYWMTADGIINDKNPRYKLLQGGDLLITDLQWEDMGAYQCIARNSIGEDSAETFVYPALNDE